MDSITLTDEDRAALKAALLAQKTEDNPTPLIALNVDLDGDGIVDAWGLDENDEVIFVSGVDIQNTGYSAGEDAGGED